MKKIKQFLLLWDGVWSIPLAFVALVFITGFIMQFYPTSDVVSVGAIIQDNFTATLRVLIASFVAQLGVYATFMLPFGIKWFDLVQSVKDKSWLFVYCLVLYCVFVVAFMAALP